MLLRHLSRKKNNISFHNYFIPIERLFFSNLSACVCYIVALSFRFFLSLSLFFLFFWFLRRIKKECWCMNCQKIWLFFRIFFFLFLVSTVEIKMIVKLCILKFYIFHMLGSILQIFIRHFFLWFFSLHFEEIITIIFNNNKILYAKRYDEFFLSFWYFQKVQKTIKWIYQFI